MDGKRLRKEFSVTSNLREGVTNTFQFKYKIRAGDELEVKQPWFKTLENRHIINTTMGMFSICFDLA